MGRVKRKAQDVLGAILEEDIPHIMTNVVFGTGDEMVRVFVELPESKSWHMVVEMDEDAVLGANWGCWRFRTAFIVGVKLRYFTACNGDT